MQSRRRRPLPRIAPALALAVPFIALVAMPIGLEACGGGSSSASPARLAVATTPPAGPLDVSKATLAFDAAPQSAQLAASETGYTGTVSASASACDGVATVAPAAATAPATFTVTAQGAGSCTLTFADAFGQTASVAVGVTFTQGAIR